METAWCANSDVVDEETNGICLKSPSSMAEVDPIGWTGLSHNVRSPPGAEPGRPQPEGETAVRTTGLLTAGRNPGDRTDPACQPLTIEGNNVPFEG